MHMHRQPLDGNVFCHRFDHRARLARSAGADGVANGNFMAAELIELARKAHHGLRIDFALIRAAQAHRHIAAHFESLRQRLGADFGKTRDAFGDGAVGVFFRERFGGRAEDDDFLATRGERGVQPLAIRHQHRIRHAGLAPDACHHLHVIRHLRHPLGRDERRGLHRLQTRILQAVDEFDFDCG